MAFRVIMIENEVSINVKLNNLVIHRGADELWVPIDDVSMIVIDNLKINITARMLCLLAMHNVGVVLCNQEHLPIGFYSSYDNYSRISKSIGFQIEKTEDFYDKLWKQIVQAKLENQAQALQRMQKREEIVDGVRKFKEEVTDGDKTNREAHAAKIYFNELMGTTFSRGNEDILMNSGLNYGYTILRSYIARVCVGYGLNTQIGIHHRNEYNRFNLVDDLIEPMRPIVDSYVYKLMENEEYFKPEHRRKLVNMLNHRIRYNGKSMFLCNMIEEYIETVAAYFAGKDVNIEFPYVDNYIGEEDEI